MRELIQKLLPYNRSSHNAYYGLRHTQSQALWSQVTDTHCSFPWLWHVEVCGLYNLWRWV